VAGVSSWLFVQTQRLLGTPALYMRKPCNTSKGQ